MATSATHLSAVGDDGLLKTSIKDLKDIIIAVVSFLALSLHDLYEMNMQQGLCVCVCVCVSVCLSVCLIRIRKY
jgi:hypothetical protein